MIYIKKIGLVIVLVVLFLAGAIVFARRNHDSDDIILPAEEIHIQDDGINVEQHEFTPRE